MLGPSTCRSRSADRDRNSGEFRYGDVRSAGRNSGEFRRGNVSVETALALPILFMFIFTGIEFSRANVLRHTVENAAYEGARHGILPGATSSGCEAAAQEVLDLVGIRGTTINVSPTTIDTGTENVSVTVTVPLNSSNSYTVLRYFSGKQFAATVTLPREQG